MDVHERHRTASHQRGVREFGPVGCPVCDAHLVAAHCMRHVDVLRHADGALLAFEIEDEGDGPVGGFSFGIMEILLKLNDPKHEMAISAFGDVVMISNDEDYNIIREGPWLDVMAALRRMLDERFGAIDPAPLLCH